MNVPQIVNTLSAPMLDALLRINSRAFTAHEVGANGSALKAMEERGLVIADRLGLPPIYALSDIGKAALAYLTADARPVDAEQPVARIQRVVAGHFRIPVTEMISERRARRVSRPRQVAMYFTHELTPLSLPNIGRRFGGRDHTTVMHAIAKVQAVMSEDNDFKDEVRTIRRALVSTETLQAA